MSGSIHSDNQKIHRIDSAVDSSCIGVGVMMTQRSSSLRIWKLTKCTWIGCAKNMVFIMNQSSTVPNVGFSLSPL